MASPVCLLTTWTTSSQTMDRIEEYDLQLFNAISDANCWLQAHNYKVCAGNNNTWVHSGNPCKHVIIQQKGGVSRADTMYVVDARWFHLDGYHIARIASYLFSTEEEALLFMKGGHGRTWRWNEGYGCWWDSGWDNEGHASIIKYVRGEQEWAPSQVVSGTDCA